MPAISDEVRTEILQRLHRAEAEHSVRILYACESGSRAWNFASPDSDYDARFIYVRTQDWYLSFDVERRRDVIEYPIVDLIDCNGWDIRKAMYLFTRTNGALLEWFNSPINYIEHGHFAQRMRELAPRAFDPKALCYHYSHMARGNAREYLFNDQVRLKKYFYVLRPLFAIRYIEQGLGVPPVPFDALATAVAPDSLKEALNKLLMLKRSTGELGLGQPIPEISEFIEAELARHGEAFSGQGRPDVLEGNLIAASRSAALTDAMLWRFDALTGPPGFVQRSFEKRSVRHQVAHDKFVPPNALLFFGDSHVQLLPVSSLPMAFYYGIGGESAGRLADRLPLYRSIASARGVVIGTGTNDLHEGRSDDEIIAEWQQSLATLPAKLKVVCLALPINAARKDLAARLRPLNQRIAAACDGRNASVIHIEPGT